MPIDKERMEAYAAMSRRPEDIRVVVPMETNLQLCLRVLFGVKRLLVVKVDPNNRADVLAELKTFCDSRGLEVEILDAKGLDVESVRGGKQVVDGPRPAWRRLHPPWWPEKPKMIIVDGLDELTDEEVLRAFLYVACLGIYSRDEIPEDMLPDGSAFVFLADEGFPLGRLAGISDGWYEESHVLENPLAPTPTSSGSAAAAPAAQPNNTGRACGATTAGQSTSLQNDLMAIGEAVCQHLWTMRVETVEPCLDAPHLLFPVYSTVNCSTAKARVSEQEARFTFTHVLDAHVPKGTTPYFYSVETPTYAPHSFTGNRGLSGQFDLTMFQAEGTSYKRVCNVEFKSDQPTHVWQDISKLVLDSLTHDTLPMGHYFHLLESADAGTLPALFAKLRKGFLRALQEIIEARQQTIRYSLWLTICILNPDNTRGRWACSRVVTANDQLDCVLDEHSLREGGSLRDQKEHLRDKGWTIMSPENDKASGDANTAQK